MAGRHGRTCRSCPGRSGRSTQPPVAHAVNPARHAFLHAPPEHVGVHDGPPAHALVHDPQKSGSARQVDAARAAGGQRWGARGDAPGRRANLTAGAARPARPAGGSGAQVRLASVGQCAVAVAPARIAGTDGAGPAVHVGTGGGGDRRCRSKGRRNRARRPEGRGVVANVVALLGAGRARGARERHRARTRAVGGVGARPAAGVERACVVRTVGRERVRGGVRAARRARRRTANRWRRPTWFRRGSRRRAGVRSLGAAGGGRRGMPGATAGRPARRRRRWGGRGKASCEEYGATSARRTASPRSADASFRLVELVRP